MSNQWPQVDGRIYRAVRRWYIFVLVVVCMAYSLVMFAAGTRACTAIGLSGLGILFALAVHISALLREFQIRLDGCGLKPTQLSDTLAWQDLVRIEKRRTYIEFVWRECRVVINSNYLDDSWQRLLGLARAAAPSADFTNNASGWRRNVELAVLLLGLFLFSLLTSVGSLLLPRIPLFGRSWAVVIALAFSAIVTAVHCVVAIGKHGRLGQLALVVTITCFLWVLQREMPHVDPRSAGNARNLVLGAVACLGLVAVLTPVAYLCKRLWKGPFQDG